MAKELSGVSSHSVPPYGPPIRAAIASGDLAKMKALARQAEQFLAEHGDVAAALELLKIEIAKIEGHRQ